MPNFADRLLEAVKNKGNPCIVGLDPRLDIIPSFITSKYARCAAGERIRRSIEDFHRVVLKIVEPYVCAVKIQIAFFEQYGIPGSHAFANTLKMAKDMGLIVIADVKRSDIGSTAGAYAEAYLARNPSGLRLSYEADSITVSPYLGRDSLLPFVEACKKYGKGIFILVKTSNPGSSDFQDKVLAETGAPLYEQVAQMVDGLGRGLVGRSGYSSIGAVVGATHPDQVKYIRNKIPRTILLVPGYGAQGASARDVAKCFNPDERGAIVNASRSITYAHKDLKITKREYIKLVERQITYMIEDINSALNKPS